MSSARRGKNANNNTPISLASVPSPALTAQETTSTIQEHLVELHKLIKQVQEERDKGDHNLGNITKTHEKMQTEQKITPYYKTKLKTLYTNAMSDAENEAEVLWKALDTIKQVRNIQNEHRIQARLSGNFNESDGPRKTMRRGVLMTMLQQSALLLPLWVGKPGESPPPLCGAIAAENNYVAKKGDKVAARVRGSDGDENWILAEVDMFNVNTNKYEVEDIDEEGKERHLLSKRRVLPLPLMKTNPETNPEALFSKGTLVMALYPQTTCFYRAIVNAPPTGPQDEYLVLFEDTSYVDGYSPPLKVAQRYVVQVKETKRR
ncbi:SAGA-associated factor 29-like [Antedon mediterranea]|uniref:SAGA-associated factor 29-like n=1 Tax=Antedon mediterranea TaxID=105859 RepID=UPI003AF98F82